MISAGIGGSQESVYEYSTTQVLYAGELIPVKSGSDRTKIKVRDLQGSMCMALDDLKSSLMAGFGTRTKTNMEVGYLPIPASYCRDNYGIKDARLIRQCL